MDLLAQVSADTSMSMEVDTETPVVKAEDGAESPSTTKVSSNTTPHKKVKKVKKVKALESQTPPSPATDQSATKTVVKTEAAAAAAATTKATKQEPIAEIIPPRPVYSTWRVRDAAHFLLQEKVPPPTKSRMNLSSQFDVDAALERLKRDKISVVKKAFDAAASTILDHIQQGSNNDGFYDHESIQDEDLPPILSDVKKLQTMRLASIERAYDNKDPTKRKLARQQETPLNLSSLFKSKRSAKKKTEAPKFTRNTPASSMAALDARLTSSRAILCTAANVTFESLTPPLEGLEVDISDVPQNPNKAGADKSTHKEDGDDEDDTTDAATVSNMGAVVVEAQSLGQRIEAVAENAAKRSSLRYKYRKDNARFDKPVKPFFQMKNPFAWKEKEGSDEEEDDDDDDEVPMYEYNPTGEALTEAWTTVCRPRLLSILHTGAGHAIYHDVNWPSRHGRIANLLSKLTTKDNNYGPHLIVTVEPDVDRFAQEFRPINSHLRLMSMDNVDSLRCLKYAGTSSQLCKLRKQFPDANGLPEAPFHVIVTSYAQFLRDYLHFCQMPFEAVLMDDGVSWLAAAQGDPNSPMGKIWDEAIWSKSDHQMGLAGTIEKEWDYSVDTFDETTIKEAWVGLTARHRIATSSILKVQQRASLDTLPVERIVNFILPHFAEVTREEWDRSRITNDTASMKHFRKLLTRAIVVHDSTNEDLDPYKLAIEALQGDLPSVEKSNDPEVPELIPDETFVSDGKVAASRRSALQWLGSSDESWLRYELGSVQFKHILEAMKNSSSYGHICEEIVTASILTSTGATGQVAGSMAYRPAVRCGRHFGSEQGLRQHHSALHAPPGTWLCRICSVDCVTSQARTHHERSCGQPNGGLDSSNGLGASTSGQIGRGGAYKGPTGIVGKKKSNKTSQANVPVKEKDSDGSIRLPGYRGVWVNQAGKHFVKVDGARVSGEDSDVIYFETADEAAKKHDEFMKSKKPKGKVEYNFKDDGNRILYEDVSTTSTTGLGGGANSVVPALSVINIKDLPPEVKPLLRDPRQTSRTGGNSKRHVYAYRGVCRQARKGHDRWQSQISFMGVNHYLGTFDSEWDAAAIYAWAHLILYGEEATKQAQKEGEEAAAAYEQEKKDIAEGKIPATPPKNEKKKKQGGKKKADGKDDDEGEGESKTGRKRGRATKDDAGGEKKRRASADKESLAPILAKGVGKAVVLAPRPQFAENGDMQLTSETATRLLAARKLRYCVSDANEPAPIAMQYRPCLPGNPDITNPAGAMLVGLSSVSFGWDDKEYVANCFDESSGTNADRALSALIAQYSDQGVNDSFRTLVQGTSTVIGCASERTRRMNESLGLRSAAIGGVIGSMDCHIGGSPIGCSEKAAYIRYSPTDSSDFQFCALSDNDLVTINGRRITPKMGCFPLCNDDVCTVGPRVFAFLLPTET
ncbi:unnamed protein product [Cylindrotheca closterium]|uniref:AP2/ERF domain-containing protein n=1 Tax=Cylindrotheca closterium TaxID=2856 RepID=A0AAD2JPD2_9STRA|nr:unnamed protein product [Cylindrotheca closterium]